MGNKKGVFDKLRSAADNKLGPLGEGGTNLGADVPAAQIQSMARMDVEKFGGPENLKDLTDDQAEIYIKSFNEARDKIINREKGWFQDEDYDTWKERFDKFDNKQKQWIEKEQRAQETLDQRENASPPASEPLDPFAEPEPVTDPIDPFEGGVVGADDQASSILADAGDDVFQDEDDDEWDDDDLDDDPNDPFA